MNAIYKAKEKYRRNHLPLYSDFARKYRARNKQRLELWKLHSTGEMTCTKFKELSKLT